MKIMSKLFEVPLLLTCLLTLAGGIAQALPLQTATPITGEVEAITLTTPGQVWSGGTMTVGGQVIILPANLLINLPNDYQSLQQLFANAPPACQATGESGLAKSDRCNDRGTGAQATILANRTDSGNIIAGQVDLVRAAESVQGTITYIDTAGGYFRVNGISGDATTGAMVRVNDPPVGPAPSAGGRHTVQSGPGCAPGNTTNCSPDTRFKIDPDNYTFCYITGYPACIPTSANDANCPASNRPPITPITSSNPFASPPVAADSRRFAPLQLGDTVKADGFFTTVGGVTFLSAASVRVMVDLTTRTIDPNTGAPDPTQPNYLIINEAGWDGPAYPAGRVRGRLLTNSTIHDSEIDFFSIHFDPVNNAPHERPLYTTRFNKQFGVVVFNVPTGVSDSQIRYDFFPGAPGTPGAKIGGGNAGADQQPCASFWGTEPKATGSPVADLAAIGISVPTFCPDSTGMGLVDNFNVMVPIFREVMARSTRSETPGAVTGVALDIHGRPTQSGFYKLPTTIDYGAFEDINLGMGQFPYQFSGNPFLLDRRLSPNGCAGGCEAAQQPLTPFPFEGIDPRNVAPTFGFVVPPAVTVLPTPNQMLTFMQANGSFTGLLPWPPTNPPAFPIVATPAFNIFPPFADEDAASTSAGVPVIIPVLANDVAIVGTIDPASVKIAGFPASGSVQVNPNGTITYTPTPTATGTIIFTYTVANNFGSVSLPGTVTVSIVAPPVAVNDNATVAAKGSVPINVAGNDLSGSNLLNLASVLIVTPASCGTLVNQQDGIVLFTAPTSVPAGGTCTFRYTINDASVPALISNIATVTVTITPPEAPVAVADTAATTTGSSVVIPVLANDTSAASAINPATVAVGAATGGTASANADGTVTYTAPSAVGTYTFHYTVQNSSATPTVSNSATVTVNVSASPPTGTILINGGAAFTNSAGVTLTLSATSVSSSVTQMQFSKDGGLTWTAFEPYATSRIVTLLPAGDGLKTVAVRYRDAIGNVSVAYSASITLITAGPTGTILINGGAAFTNSAIVTLTLSATSVSSSVTQMQFSKDGGLTWTAFEPYATSRIVTLSPAGDGLKTVAVRYRDAIGNVSGAYSASITLSTAPPTGSILINGGAAFTNSAIVNLTLSATAVNSSVTQMQFSKDGGVTWTAFEPYATSRTVTLLPVGDGVKTVAVKYMDSLGNVSGAYSASITVSTVPPTGSILINGGAATTNSATVTLTLSATAVNSSVSQMQFSKDGGVTWTAFEPYATTRDVTLTPTGPGTKTVAVQYKDTLGNVSPSYQASILLQ